MEHVKDIQAEDWDLVIQPKSGWRDLLLHEIWRYRDFQFLVGFSVQLLMYATPVIYPLSFLEAKYRWISLANPMTAIIEAFKYAYLGAGSFNFYHLAYSFCMMLFLFLSGVLIFHKVEKTFMDTV